MIIDAQMRFHRNLYRPAISIRIPIEGKLDVDRHRSVEGSKSTLFPANRKQSSGLFFRRITLRELAAIQAQPKDKFHSITL